MTTAPNYRDFAIQIEEDGDDGFRARILDSPYNRGETAPCALPFRPEELTRFLEDLEPAAPRASPAGGTFRDLSAGGPAARSPGLLPEEVGARLFAALFQDRVREILRSSLADVGARPGAGLRLRIVLDPKRPRLAPWSVLPWELLYLAETQDFLSRDLRTPVVRYFGVSRPTSPPPPITTLRVLVVSPCPRHLTPLDHQQELDGIASAWGDRDGLEIRYPAEPTVRGLRRALRKEEIHALHFIGHGAFDPATGEGMLFFEDGRGNAEPVSGQVLADTLKTTVRVRLALLNACESAQLPHRDGHNPFAGIASALVMAGIPAVVAHQFRISDRAAITFSEVFYHALAQGDPVDAAVSEGRLAVLQTLPRSWEWMTPALYMGTPDGILFERRPAEIPAETRRPETGDPLSPATFQLEIRRYAEALAALEEVLRDDPRNGEIYYFLALAQIGGRRPRTLTFDVVARIEQDLETAARLGAPAAHVAYLQALLKADHYPWSGRTMTAPTPEELVAEAADRPADQAALDLLLEHVPTPDNAVRTAIQRRAESLRSS